MDPAKGKGGASPLSKSVVGIGAMGGGGGLAFPPLYRNSDEYRYSPFYVQRSLCPLIILVFELYPCPDCGLTLRFLFCFEESASKYEIFAN